MVRQIRSIVPEPTEEDDLLDTGTGSLVAHVGRRPPIEVAEVRLAQRVHEVVDDVDAVERAALERAIAVAEAKGATAIAAQLRHRLDDKA